MVKRILVSNDDGIDAPGLAALAEAVAPFGEVFIVAPDRDQSGTGHSLTLHRPLRLNTRGPRRFSVDGTPTDCVSLGIQKIMSDRAPDLVLSGINGGPNLGDDVTYSGTVAAALEGALLGIPSVAISLAAAHGEEPNFRPAAKFMARFMKKLVETDLPKGLVFNVNVPNVLGDAIEPYEFTRLGRRRYASAVEEKIDPRGRKYYWIGADELDFDDIPGSDSNAIRTGKISITPIRLDFTHDHYLKEFGTWKF